MLHLLCSTQPSRSKAVSVAAEEMRTLFADCGVEIPSGGPLSDRSGVYWVDLPDRYLGTLDERAPWIGYTRTIQLLEPTEPGGLPRTTDDVVRWKSSWYILTPIWTSDDEEIRMTSADRRTFYLRDARGGISRVNGYRGDGTEGGPKALPVIDSRLLVNLAYRPEMRSLLDPFAGAGGIVVEALRRGLDVSSMDIAPHIAPGLERFGADHTTGDAAGMPYADRSFDGLATELPYSVEDPDALRRWVSEMARVLRPHARCAIMCSSEQRGMIQRDLDVRGAELGMDRCVAEYVRRRGTSVAVMVYTRTAEHSPR